ncbi:MAG: hypothetical protein HQ473_07175 [Cryomorphaceae bacterium]|jgi:hypothetical protein|nr:hypothetical protein [Cryomorphaceae bacterium]
MRNVSQNIDEDGKEDQFSELMISILSTLSKYERDLLPPMYILRGDDFLDVYENPTMSEYNQIAGSLVKLQQVLCHSSTSISYLFERFRSTANGVGGYARNFFLNWTIMYYSKNQKLYFSLFQTFGGIQQFNANLRLYKPYQLTLRSQEEEDQDVDRNQIEELIQSQTPAVH